MFPLYNSQHILCLLCVQRVFDIFHKLTVLTHKKLERTIPGFRTIVEKAQADAAERRAKRKAERAARKKAALFGGGGGGDQSDDS